MAYAFGATSELAGDRAPAEGTCNFLPSIKKVIAILRSVPSTPQAHPHPLDTIFRGFKLNLVLMNIPRNQLAYCNSNSKVLTTRIFFTGVLVGL